MTQPSIQIAYGPDENQYGLLRLPSHEVEGAVVAVVIHGGFWRTIYGLELMEPFSEVLTDDGYVTWNIEYRRTGQSGGGYPGTLQDVWNAVDHLQEIAKAYPINLHKVVVIGHSAGGQLALWAGGRQRLPSGSEARVGHRPLVAVQRVMCLGGVADLRTMWELLPDDSPCAEFLGGTPSEVPDRYQAASPAELLPLGIKQILMHGDADDVVPIEVARTYVSKAVGHGDAVRLVELEGENHASAIDVTSNVWSEVVKVIQTLTADI